jgi:Sec-independent protein translocase protein TatA
MGDIGFSELVAIVIIAILLYGKDLPQAARKLAALYSKFRRQIADIKDEIHRQMPTEELKQLESLTSPYEGAEPPQPPLSLSVTPTAEHVQLTWMSSTGATSYSVKRSAGPTEPMLVLAMYLTDLSYTDTDIVAGKTYHYTVTASNTAGESGNSDEAVCTVPGGESPTQGQGEGQAQGTAAEAPPAPAPGETSGPAPAGGI